MLRGCSQWEREDVSCRRGQSILILGSSVGLCYTLWSRTAVAICPVSSQAVVVNGRTKVVLQECVFTCECPGVPGGRGGIVPWVPLNLLLCIPLPRQDPPSSGWSLSCQTSWRTAAAPWAASRQERAHWRGADWSSAPLSPAASQG